MKTSTTTRRVLWALSLCTIVTGTAVAGALLFELSVIGYVERDLRGDVANAQAGIAGSEPATSEERINPSYLKRYGLDRNLYKDSHGNFAPTGADWRQWGLRTKVAATVMWLGHDPPGTWWTYAQIKCVDRFPEAHADSERIADVADACLGVPH
ncbi:hypothetical protein EVC45_15520 [Paraburkholderia sp. UYCP14C]|uniref:hypothetical protein n=1 Tax=Paraburkholderia sp. UYCP14C TaxID=2511130 RepID=UPI0010205371|nr:hypothetical protein [Paraburkholderia sp. UYCP14C]RZF28916.1 hypothetical protein EVC45_15520 [Paraburkholderia sp. UYCP14C]